MLAGILKENGVIADGINFDKGARTALAFVTLRADGEREFMFYRNPSADMLLTPEELNLELIRSVSDSSNSVAWFVFDFGVDRGGFKGARVFHYGSISLIVEPCRSAHLKAIEAAKEAGALLSYDPNLRLPLWPSPEEAREQILSIWDKAENFHGSVEAFHVNTVDTTGAGDSFVGALLLKIVDDQSILEDEPRLREVLKFANACGAITTTKKGAIPALPTEDEALCLIKGSK
ncbi:hypothetical protein GH714_006734 [Hevea brasiliensis]|uniref:Carbohydrate kinase PfkB domain-containing protein n=1 Tax=Hevea brasiliensis TaxID=3981 RepID=A0A6A6NB67_HEVBR|nr:hypothetical protein GH714_006734 [Hevea brasiliensis]